MLHASRIATLCALPALLAACAGEPPREAFFDLVAELPAAAVHGEARSIVLGRPDARPHLGAGWWNQVEHDGSRGFVWSSGPASTVVFHLLAPRDLTLRLEGRPFNYPGSPRQTVTVAVNGTLLDTVTLARQRRSYALPVPAALLRAGDNTLALRYGYSARPLEVVPGGRDQRALGVAWYAFHFDTVDAPGTPAPRVDLERGLLFLPFGSVVEYFLTVPAGSALELAGAALRGEAAGRFELLVEDEGGAPRTVAAFGRDRPPPLRIDLGGDGERLVRLALRATTVPGAPAEAGGVALERPRLTRPPSATVAGPPPAAPAAIASRPNILLYLIDTLRADHLGCYGYPRPISPHLDAFAQRAALFENAIAQSSWTKASVASILTGLWPRAHGANRRSDTLAAEAVLLPEVLRAAGYTTAGIVTNPNVTPSFGFDQGYDHFDYLGEAIDADEVNAAALSWLDGDGGASSPGSGAPFFLYLHTIDPHAPYTPPAAFRERFAPSVSAAEAERSMATVNDLQAGRRPVAAAAVARIVDLYDAEIAFNDDAFGVLLGALAERGLYRDTLIVVVSDHGEEFHEHGNFQHGRALHRESVHVPLIVKLPGDAVAPRRIAERVQHLDLVPTVLDLLGLPPLPAHAEGRSLLPLIRGQQTAPAPSRRVFSYLHLDGPPRISVHDLGFKLIAGVTAGDDLIRTRLYRPAEDPGEHRDLAAARPVRGGYLAALLRARLRTGEARLAGAEAVIDDELRKSLQALGYLE